jgi:hypothetical protein
VGKEMSRRIGRRPVKKNRIRRAIGNGLDGAWLQLPKSVVEARAGLIPSCEIDAIPPPEPLTATELTAWHAGLPVFCRRT